MLATSSSETALADVDGEAGKAWAALRSLVGLVVPTGYTFNTDGSGYIHDAGCVVRGPGHQHAPRHLLQQLDSFLGCHSDLERSKGRARSVLHSAGRNLVSDPDDSGSAGMALILGIDRFMSMCRGLVNMIGNGVATLVVARWENELSGEALRGRLA